MQQTLCPYQVAIAQQRHWAEGFQEQIQCVIDEDVRAVVKTFIYWSMVQVETFLPIWYSTTSSTVTVLKGSPSSS